MGPKRADGTPRRPDAWCVLGNLYMAAGDFKHADGAFKSLLASAEECEGHTCKLDGYANASLAWIQIQLAQSTVAPSAPLIAACGTRSGEESVDRAGEMLRKVLIDQPSNLYAANGLGVVCVAKGRLHEARQIFTQVRESSSDCAAASMNLAQVNAALGEHAQATALYDAIAKKASASSEMTAARLLLAARSHYYSGKVTECRSALLHALIANPSNHAAWHNMCLALLASARHRTAPTLRRGSSHAWHWP